ncbi:leucine-rich repeat-containing protein 59 [Biomphalaria pfeifferi]|uniref:Leucine-rich repeat-containing protein 59 n=1 Tax=Biomphalaria pfeifferi TaxID=112525 RepID=A0AAD8FH21_BIOPF|nr:leucine-rich repeat-containing protein 59 [Biomphalaria pfeifferi]
MPKESLREKLNHDNELDLSLNNLETVPVKDLAALPKATHLDLSNNLLTALPDSFCSLIHLVKLDLSKNALTELPRLFGQLENLQHLDLLGNQLKTLPRSFCQLKKLKWLDLKDNPLEEGLKKNAGNCLNEIECKKCATRILMYMTDLDGQLELQSQAKKKKQEEAEAKQKDREEREKQKKRQEKKAEKERRRREHEARRAQELLAQNGDTSDEEITAAREKLKYNAGLKRRDKGQGSRNCFLIVLFSFLALFGALLVAIDFHCISSAKDEMCASYWQPTRAAVISSWELSKISALNFYANYIEKFFSPKT